jgi:prolyl oligopeptidase
MPALPRRGGGLWFRIDPDARAPSLIVGASSMGSGLTLRAGAREAEDREAPCFEFFSPSPDGKYVAYGAPEGGGLQGGVQLQRLRVMEVESGHDLSFRIDHASCSLVWLPDSSGFYVVRGTASAMRDPTRLISFVSLANGLTVDEPLRGLGFATWLQLSSSGRWLIAVTGTREPRADWILDRQEEKARWQPFLMHVPAAVTGAFLGEDYVAISYFGTPRGRVVSFPVEASHRPEACRELVPQTEEVIRGLSVVGSRLVIHSLANACSKLRIYRADGKFLAELSQPKFATVGRTGWSQLLGQQPVSAGEEEFIYIRSTFDKAPSLHRYSIPDGSEETLVAPATTIPNAKTTESTITADDGVKIPIKIVRCGSSEAPIPTTIYCYGAYNFALVPGWLGPFAPLVESGGAVAFAHLRGGGEFGADWWRAGHHEHRQRCFDDIYSVAQGLIDNGVTPKGKIALVGHSNGGLNVATALVQRPDLFSVGIALAPHTDLLRYSRDPFCGGLPVEGHHEGCHVNGGTWRNPTWGHGNADTDFEEAGPLLPQSMYAVPLGYSPYHLIREMTVYPAILAVCGTEDVWCPPWHSRKLIARMQAASCSDNPILLRVWEGAGHSAQMGEAAQVVEWVGFIMQQLGMSPLAN